MGCHVVAQIPRCSVHTSLGNKVPMVGFARESFLTAASTQIAVTTKNRAGGSSGYHLTVPECLFCSNRPCFFLKSE